MTRRSVPYPDTRALVAVPVEVWRRTIEELASYAPFSSEALVFWGGIVSGESIQATGLYLPRHPAQGGCVRLTEAETRWLLRALRDRDEKLIAQIHSHPGSAFHSAGDDERAASFHRGYISVVAPRFAVGVDSLSDCAVFEFDGHHFRELSPAEIRARVQVTRLVEERVLAGGPISQRPRRFRWLTTIVSSLRAKLTEPRRR